MINEMDIVASSDAKAVLLKIISNCREKMPKAIEESNVLDNSYVSVTKEFYSLKCIQTCIHINNFNYWTVANLIISYISEKLPE